MHPYAKVLLHPSLFSPGVTLDPRSSAAAPSTSTYHVDAELLEMIERADTDQDGEINAEEFYAIMTKKTFT